MLSLAAPASAHSPVASGKDHRIIRIGELTSTKAKKDTKSAAALCAVGKTTFNRTESCYNGTAPVQLVNESTGSVEGRATLHITSQAQLDPRNRYKWEHKLQLEITNPVGAPAWTITGSVSMKCSACQTTGGGGSALFPDVPANFTMGLSSPGDKLVNDKQVPQVTITAPRYSTATGDAGDALTVRCDNTAFVSPRDKGGCVYPEFTPTWDVAVTDSRVSDVAWHIYWAQNNLKRPWGRKADGPALHRTMDKALAKANRKIACPKSIPRPAGKSCDEFPYASTYEGASKNSDFSCHMVNKQQNSEEGSLKKTWQNSVRLLEHDAFWVNVVGAETARQPASAGLLSQCPE